MKRILLIAVIASVLAVPAMAQKVKGMGMVDFTYIVLESKGGQKAQAESDAFEQELNNRLLPLRNELIAIQNDFNAREGTLTDAQKVAIANDFQTKNNTFEATARAYAAEVQKKNAELSEKVVGEVKAVIAEVAKEKKINIIVEKDTILFSEDIPDITEDVLIRYNLKISGK